MGEKTGVSWTDHTWNPWMGCHHISPGCLHCYMYRDMRQYGRDPETVVRAKTTFGAPLKWKEPARVFTCSWSDFFIREADPWREEAWDIMRRTPHLTYQVLTKRPHRMLAWAQKYGWLDNAWAGVTVENQVMADIRLPLLMKVPAVVRFISAEPILEPIRLGAYLEKVSGINSQDCPDPAEARRVMNLAGIALFDQVIVGGESGGTRREMDPAWLVNIVRDCQEAGVVTFVKQASGPRPGMQGNIPDDIWALKQFPSPRATEEQEK